MKTNHFAYFDTNLLRKFNQYDKMLYSESFYPKLTLINHCVKAN